jgi:hygromycin-B 4-O-kinase
MNNPTAPDIKQVQAFLKKHFDTASSTVEFAGEGAWSQCFGFRHGGKDLVVRFGKHVDDFLRDELAGPYAAPGLPIPDVIEIGQAFDGYYAVSTRARGIPLENLDAAGWRAITPAVAIALEAMRMTDISSTRGFGGWGSDGVGPFDSWSGYLLSVAEDTSVKRTHGWRKRLGGSQLGESTFAWGFDRLKSIASDSVPRCLVHGDLINRNVLVNDNRISGIFDWGCSIYGDHLYDLAWFEFWAPWYPDMNVEYLKSETERRWHEAGCVPANKETRLLACHLHIGLDHLAYNAFTENWSALSDTAHRMKELVNDR